MSVPDSHAADADHGIVRLTEGGSGATVTSGVVDVFAVSDAGVRYPLAVLSENDVALGCGHGVTVIVVPRQGGAAVAFGGERIVDAAERASFVAAVVAELGALAQPLSDASGDSFDQALAGVVAAVEQQDQSLRISTAAHAMTAGEQAYDHAIARIGFSSTHLEDPPVDAELAPIVAALALLGHEQGFEVVAPTVEALRNSHDPLRLVAHTSGLRYRSVMLGDGWQKRSQGAYLAAIMSPGQAPAPVVLTHRRSGYRIQRATDIAPGPLTAELAAQLAPQGFEFYAPLPQQRSAQIRDVIRMAFRGMTGLWGLASLMAFGVAMLGLLTPVLTNVVIGDVIPTENVNVLVQAGFALAIAAGAAFVFTLVQNYTVSLISQRATRTTQAAMWDRVLSLPAGFFRRFSSGDLTVRVMAVDSLSSLLSSQVVSALLAAVFGLVNLVLMFYYNVALGIAGLVFLAGTALMLVLSVRSISRYATASLKAQRQGNGWMVQMLQGIMKIRLAAAEPQMEAHYLDLARRQAVAMSRQTLVIGRINAWFIFAASGASALFYLVILLQWQGKAAPLSTADYMSFASAYSLAFAAVAGLVSLISPLANAGPTFSLLSPIMETLPETSGDRQDPGKLAGRVELRDVAFRYTPDGPRVLKGLNIAIEPGSMVALVGPSGAGKSTITRLLLGFDTPERGQVLFDGRDLQSLDPTMVRAQMGVVVQEGRITRGSIMKNILGATEQNEDLAWSAAEKAALADDIRKMPMGMQTVVDPGNVSGGQAQRILLARALVHNPSILILDEATSALDNASQKVVTEAMEALHATRIVIAHRLSTIRSADRIIVMQAGVAVESGTFDELMAAGGVFTSLVTRQVA